MADSKLENFTAPTVTVKHGEDSFEFTVPTIHDEIRVGTRIQKLHKQIDPDWDGFEQGLDALTAFSLRACATFELLLRKSSAKWPWTETATGVICDSSKFPATNSDDALVIYRGLLDALASFREKRADGAEPSGA